MQDWSLKAIAEPMTLSHIELPFERVASHHVDFDSGLVAIHGLLQVVCSESILAQHHLHALIALPVDLRVVSASQAVAIVHQVELI